LASTLKKCFKFKNNYQMQSIKGSFKYAGSSPNAGTSFGLGGGGREVALPITAN